jgi:hypothetical protein
MKESIIRTREVAYTTIVPVSKEWVVVDNDVFIHDYSSLDQPVFLISYYDGFLRVCVIVHNRSWQ